MKLSIKSLAITAGILWGGQSIKPLPGIRECYMAVLCRRLSSGRGLDLSRIPRRNRW